MKVGDLVKHKREDYGVGIVTRVYTFNWPDDRAKAFFSRWGDCTFRTIDLEVINEDR